MRRYVLRKKEIKKINEYTQQYLNFTISKDDKVEILEKENKIILINGIPALFYYEEKHIPTLKFLYNISLEKSFVMVDVGAIPHILNGAKIFAAGIVNADKDIRKGDIVTVIDEKYEKPIAVGIALINGTDMIEQKTGIALKNIHYVGDEIWNLKL